MQQDKEIILNRLAEEDIERALLPHIIHAQKVLNYQKEKQARAAFVKAKREKKARKAPWREGIDKVLNYIKQKIQVCKEKVIVTYVEIALYCQHTTKECFSFLRRAAAELGAAYPSLKFSYNEYDHQIEITPKH